MQATTYEHVHELSSDVMRERERMAFDQGLALLKEARDAPDDVNKCREAARHMQLLWSFLIKDLTHPANDLSDDLKGNLVSIGLWVIRETDAILAGRSSNWAALIDINSTVREGLNS